MKIAILGASSIAAKILPTLKTLPMFEIAGVASTDRDRGSVFANDHGTLFLGDYQAVYQNRNINAVYVTTANQEHESCIENALLSGKHVLCEKPLVLTSAAARRLFELSKKMDLILLEGLMYRFHPQIREMLKHVHSGEYGSPRRINATFSFDYGTGLHLDRRLLNGGGALPDLGCYLIDFVSLISNGSPVEIVQKMENQTAISFGAILKLKNGIIAEVRSLMTSPSINTWEVICERGSLSVNRYNPHEASESILQIVDDDSQLTSIKVPKDGSGLDQFKQQFINFHDSIVGKAQPFISADESICNAVLMDSIQNANPTLL